MDENQKELNKENKKIIKFNLNEHSVLNKIIQHPIIKHLASFFKSIGEDNISSYASEAALFTIISFFPFLMLFFIIVSFTPLTPGFILRLINDSFPSEIKDIFHTIINQINNTSKTVIVFTSLTALWSASRGFMAIVKGLNKIYKTGEKRNGIIIRFYSLLYTIGFAILLALTLILLVFGNSLYQWLISVAPWITDLALLVMGMRASVILVFLFLYFLIMFVVMPNRKSNIFYEFPGALLASVGWIVFSYGFSFYIDHMANFSVMYGSLTAIVLLLLWVYFCMYILFVAAELNYKLRNYVAKKIDDKRMRRKAMKL